MKEPHIVDGPWRATRRSFLFVWALLLSVLVLVVPRYAPMPPRSVSCHHGPVVVPVRRTWVLPCHTRHPKFRPGRLIRLPDATYLPVRSARWYSGAVQSPDGSTCLREYTRTVQEQWTDWPECAGSPWIVSEQLPWPHAMAPARTE
jgi:hypothetical protein